MRMDWTPEQIEAEQEYRFYERLGILCGLNTPTMDEIAMAQKDANEWQPDNN